MVREITVGDAAHARRINHAACSAPFEVWLHERDGSGAMVDARSLLGIYTLAGKRAYVVVEDGVNPRSFERLVRSMETRKAG